MKRSIGTKFLRSLAVFVVCGFVFHAGFRLLLPRYAGVPVVSKEFTLATSLQSDENRRGALATSQERHREQGPRNVILVLADGLGFAHVAITRFATVGADARLALEQLPVTGWHHSFSQQGLFVDSASSATALSTGQRVPNGAVAWDESQPVGQQALPTLLEQATEAGWRTAVVTDSYFWDATPAAFATHAMNRDRTRTLIDGFAVSELDLLAGEVDGVSLGSSSWKRLVERLSPRFDVVTSLEDFRSKRLSEKPIAALFPGGSLRDGTSKPNLKQLTQASLKRLSRDPTPFFLLLESEEADTASHKHQADRLVAGLQSLDAAIAQSVEFAHRREDTLVLVTADHETGGLSVISSGPDKTRFRASWATTGHTAAPVPVYAYGPGAYHFSGVHSAEDLWLKLSRLVLAQPAEKATTPPQRAEVK